MDPAGQYCLSAFSLFSFLSLSTTEALLKNEPSHPPMHWHSWNTFRGEDEVNYTNMLQMTDALLESGLVEVGFDTVNVVCNGWTGRDPKTGKLQQNMSLWPQGIQALGDYLHSHDLKLGCYTSPAVKNCCGEPGSLNYEDIDMQTFADWGCDHIMVDWCHKYVNPRETRDEYAKIGEAINKTNRSMLYGIWSGGFGKSWKWGESAGGNYWRTSADITNEWSSVLFNFDTPYSIPDIAHYSVPGHFTFLDQTVLGVTPGPGKISGPGLSPDEARAHLTMWIMAASPLMICNDLRNFTGVAKELLLNEEAMAIHRDPLAAMAQRIDVGGYMDAHADRRSWSVYQKPLANGSNAIMILNRGESAVNPVVYMEDIGNSMETKFTAYDLWEGGQVVVDNSMQTEVPSHGVRFFLMTAIVPAPPPSGYDATARPGYWSNPTPSNITMLSSSTTIIDQCAADCSAMMNCLGFEVFDAGEKMQECYVFLGALQEPFTVNNDCQSFIKK